MPPKYTLFEKVANKIWKFCYFQFHPTFSRIYSKRFSKDFNQEDLVYCVTHLYNYRMRKTFNLSSPKTFNEKLTWLKCFYHDDRMTVCADKATAPYYFQKETGLNNTHVVKNYGVYDAPEDIDFDTLPNEFVIKSNWGSSKQIIVKNKKQIDLVQISDKIRKWTNYEENHYFRGFEYSYKNIVPKIICEELLIFDYKIEFFCFDGKPLYFWTVYNDKTDSVSADFYDANSLKKLSLKQGYPNSHFSFVVPDDYEEMFRIASKLSGGFPFVRIDFFKTSESFKFSEMTFYHWGGCVPFEPASFDFEFGEKIKLPEVLI